MNKLKIGQKVVLSGMLLGLAGFSTMSSASGYDRDRSWNKNSFFDYARVTQAEPIYQTIEHQVPREECWNEKVRYTPERHNSHRRHKSSTPLIIGALIGGALGNELGHHKRNKQVGAAVGAILGGSIGADVQRQNRRDRHDDNYDGYDVAYRDEQRCKTYYEIETEQRLSGYEVSYRYNGHDYQTITDQHPGKKLRIKVGIRPAE